MSKTVYTGYDDVGAVAAAHSSVTDFFEPEPVEKAVAHRKNCTTRALTIGDQSPLHIIIPPEGDYFIDPASFRLNADLRVKKKNGPNWINLDDDDAAHVAPINLFSKSLFKDIEIYMQTKQISRIASTAYPYKAYIETLCSYGKDAVAGHLGCSYYVKDDPGKHDVITAVAGVPAALNVPAVPEVIANSAFAKRHAFIANSKLVQISEPLNTDISTLNRLIPSGLDMQFVFQMANINFILQSTEGEYRIIFEDFYLSYDRVALDPKLLYSIEAKLSKNVKAIFPINRGVVRTHQVGMGESYVKWAPLYHGILPETVTICMVESRAYNASAAHNCYNFQHFNMTSISLKKNSVAIPSSAIETNFVTGDVYRLYRHYFDNIGIEITNNPTLITFEDFKKGTTIIPFDLTADRCALFHNHEKESGVIELDIKFSDALPRGITVLALCSYSDKFYVTGGINQRQVLLPIELK